MKKIFLFFGILLIMSACSQRVVDFTIISTKNIDFSNKEEFQRGKNRITGIDKKHFVIIVPIGSPNMKEAIDAAIESTPDCIALVDGVVYYKFWIIPLIYGQMKYIVEGTPLIDPTIGSINNNVIPDYCKIELNSSNKIINIENITKEEYVATKNLVVKQGMQIRFNN
jgi:hypothetical protein